MNKKVVYVIMKQNCFEINKERQFVIAHSWAKAYSIFLVSSKNLVIGITKDSLHI